MEIHAGPARIGRDDGVKQGGEWWHDTNSITRRTGSKSAARKAASAMIAEIPFELSSWVARCFRQERDEAELPPVSPIIQDKSNPVLCGSEHPKMGACER